MQLNYFTVSHDIIFLFGSSGDVKLSSSGAKVDFSGWVLFFFFFPLLYSTVWIFLVIRKLVYLMRGVPWKLRADKPSLDLFTKKVKAVSGWSLSYLQIENTRLFFNRYPVLLRVASLFDENHIPCGWTGSIWTTCFHGTLVPENFFPPNSWTFQGSSREHHPPSPGPSVCRLFVHLCLPLPCISHWWAVWGVVLPVLRYLWVFSAPHMLSRASLAEVAVILGVASVNFWSHRMILSLLLPCSFFSFSFFF